MVLVRAPRAGMLGSRNTTRGSLIVSYNRKNRINYTNGRG